MILTSNKAFREWGGVFGDDVIAGAPLDRVLHHAVGMNIRGASYRLRERAADLGPEDTAAPAMPPAPAPRHRGRPPKAGATGRR